MVYDQLLLFVLLVALLINKRAKAGSAPIVSASHYSADPLFRFVKCKSIYINPNLLWPLLDYIIDLLYNKRQQSRPRCFIILSCQTFNYFAYFTTLT